MDLSIVISLYNENESLRELTEWIDRAIAQSPIAGIEYEILMIDDGSDDGSWDTIKELSDVNPHIRAYSFRRNYGKSAALQTGFREAAGDVVITMDADLQDSPDEIPELYRMIREDGYDLVSGWKKVRHDNTFTKNIPSKIYNFTARKVTGLKLHDMNCGLKAYRGEVVKEIEVYGDMHRYIPYIAKNAGFTRIGEKVVVHRKRKYGKSKFGMSRFFNGFLDLMTIWFLSSFGKKPMHIFGVWGIVSLRSPCTSSESGASSPSSSASSSPSGSSSTRSSPRSAGCASVRSPTSPSSTWRWWPSSSDSCSSSPVSSGNWFLAIVPRATSTKSRIQ